MKYNTKKSVQLFALLICLLIMGASTVYAASYQAKIGKNNYETIQDAVNAVKSGQTIKLVKNVELAKDEVIELNRNVKYTIDMNGKMISRNEEQDDEEGEFDYKSAVTCMRATMGNVTIQNGKMKALANSGSGIILSGRASVTLKGGSYINEQISVYEQAKLTVANTSFNSTEDPAIAQRGGKIIINGCTIKAPATNCLAIRGGKTIINNGKLTGGSSAKNYPAIYMNQNASLVIKKCELKSDDDGIYVDKEGKPSITIMGGTHTAKKCLVRIENRSGKLKITGGSFNSIGQYAAIWTNAPTNISGGKFTAKNANAVYDESESACTITGGIFTNNSKKYPTLYSIFHFKKVSGAKVVNKGSNKKNMTVFNALM